MRGEFGKLIELIKEEWALMKTKPLSLIGWLIGVITGVAATVLTIIEKLDPKVIIIGELILIFIILWKYHKLKYNSIRLENLYIDNVPMISTLSYILNARKRTEFNYLDMSSVTIKYKLEAEKEDSDLLIQDVTWVFEGENRTSEAVTKAIMMVSKSVYSRYSEIELTATDLRTGKPLRVDHQMPAGANRYISIVFDEEGIPSSTRFYYQVRMHWNVPGKFREPDFYIIDPQNYSMNTNTVRTIIETDSDKLAGTPVTCFSLNRNTMTYMKDEYNSSLVKDANGNYSCQRSFNPNAGKLYLIKLGSNMQR